MEPTLPEDFSAFLRLLGEHRVDYLIVGGYAVGHHGYPRVTGDISGVTFGPCWEGRVDDTLDGVPVHILSLSDLKTNKRASGRAKDQADLDELP